MPFYQIDSNNSITSMHILVVVKKGSEILCECKTDDENVKVSILNLIEGSLLPSSIILREND